MRGIYGRARIGQETSAGADGTGGWDPSEPDRSTSPPPTVELKVEEPIEIRWPPAAVQQHNGWRTAWMVASTASMALCVYHGYKRNDSIGWALGWGLFGSLAPVVAPTIALAQGFGKPR